MAPPRSTRVQAEVLEPDDRLDGIGLHLVRQQRGLTASAVRPSQEGRDSRKYKRITQEWQAQVFTYYHSIPECWYAAQFYARSLSQIRLYVGRRDDQGEIKELEKGDPAAKLLDRIRDPSGGRSQLLASYGRLRFLVGECFLVCSMEENGTERWEALSNREIRQYDSDSSAVGPRRYVRVRAPGLDPEDLADDGQDEDLRDEDVQELADGTKTQLPPRSTTGSTQAIVWRLWRRDPEYSSWSDAPTRAVLNLFEQLLLLEMTVNARAKSRLAGAGILLLAQELDFGPPEPNKGDTENPKKETFMDRLQRAMVTPIKDPGSARQVVPIVGRIPAELMDRAYSLIKIHDPNEKIIETEIIDKLLFRIATGLDMPHEMLLGMADVNHWGSWQIDESAFKQHIRPVVQELVDDVTSAYLIPAALLDEKIQDPHDLVVGYDPAALVNHPDKSKDAKELRALGAVTLDALREATGFNDNDALDWDSEDEKDVFDRELWLALAFNDPQLLPEKIRPEPPMPTMVDEDGNPITDVPPGTPPELAQTFTGQEGGPTGDPQDKPQPEKPEDEDEEKRKEDEEDRIAAAAVLASAALTARRARELAGSRLRSRVNGEFKDTPNDELAAAVGAEKIQELGLTAAGLVTGSSDLFTRHLVDEGIEPRVAEKLGQMVEQYATKTLCEPMGALPDLFGSYVRRVV